MRLLRFFLVFLGTAILVVGSIYLINRDSFHTVYHNRAALAEGSEWVEKTYSLGGLISFMSEQPQHAALAATGGPAIQYQSRQMIPAGTLSSLFLILSYAEQVTTGRIDPDTAVDTDRIRIFYLPEWDQRHISRFNRWVRDRAPLTIGQLVRYYVDSRDPAVAGFLYFHIGEDAVNDLTARLGDGYIEPPVPLFGFRMLALQNGAEPEQLSERLAHLADRNRPEILRDAAEIARRQWEQPRTISSGDAPRISSFQAERELHRLYPALQPDRFLKLLTGIWNDEIVDVETSSTARELLQIPTDDRLLDRHVTGYASHFDERMGYMNGWSIAKLTDDGRLQAHVILFHDLPAGLWFHMNSNFMTRDFHHRLFYDQDVQHRTYQLLSGQDALGCLLFSENPYFTSALYDL